MYARTRLASFFTIACAFFSVSAGAADLITTYRDAQTYDAPTAAARAQLAAGREKLPQGRAGLLPSISLNANSTHNDLSSTLRTNAAPTTATQYNSHGWTLQLTQPLFRMQNWLSFNQGELAAAAAELQFGLAEQDLILRVTQAYFDLLLAQEAVATTQAQLQAIAEQLAAAKQNFTIGTATITDSHEAQARFDLASAQEIAAQNDLLVRQQALQLISGKAAGHLRALKPSISIAHPQPDDMSKWGSSAEASSLSVLLAQNNLEIASREQEKQRAGHLPTLDLVATRGNASQASTLALGSVYPGSTTDSTTIGVQLAIPLYSGGATVSRERESLALKEKAQAELLQARRVAAFNARQAWLGVNSGLAQIKAFSAALASSQSALDSNKLAYEVGVRINIDVLNAQAQLYETRQKLMKAKLDTLLAQLRLKAAAGSLGEADLVGINALLD